MSFSHIDKLELESGFLLTSKFEVKEMLGHGWEGEVYSIQERSTGIERAAKIFYPERNIKNRSATIYAKKLHKLRNCDVLIKYLFQDQIRYKGNQLTFLISEYIEGETLDVFLCRQKGKRLHYFQALHLLYKLSQGLEEIHQAKEYHGDLHTSNIIIQKCGLEFDIKLIDLFYTGSPSLEAMKMDICDSIRIFYDSLGGAKHYSNQPRFVKEICCGLKRTNILRKFRSARQLRQYLEDLSWD